MGFTLEQLQAEKARRAAAQQPQQQPAQAAPAAGGTLTLEQLQAEKARRQQAAQPAQAPEETGIVSDVGQSFSTGVRSGLEGTAGLPGDVGSWQGNLLAKGAEYLGAEPGTVEGIRKYGGGLPGLFWPKTEDIHKATVPIVGESYEPKTKYGEYAKTGGEFATSALGPGGPLTRAARVIVPAAATQLAGDVAEQIDPRLEGPVRMVVGFLSSAGTAKVADTFKKRSALRQVNTSPAAVKQVERELMAQGMTPEEAGARMKELGVGTTYADTGGNTQQLTQQIQARGGKGRGIISGELKAREKGANQRLEADIVEAVGPEQQRTTIMKALEDRKEALGPDYEAAHAAQTQPVNTQSILDNIDTDLANVKSAPLRAKMKQVRDSLHIMDKEGVASPHLDPSSEGLHNARKAIDGMMYDQTGRPKDIGADEARILSGYRKQIDEALGTSTPIKEVDAQYHQIGKEERALGEGEKLFDTTRGTASPTEFKTTFDAMTPGEQQHLLSGVNLETWRQVGINANDRVTLQKVLKGEGKWNFEKLGSVIGMDKTQKLAQALEREKVWKDTYNRVIENSKTAETQGGKRQSLAEAVVNATPEVLAMTAVGGPQAGAVTAAAKMRQQLAAMLAGGSEKLDADTARLLMSQDPEQMVQLAQFLKRDKGAVLPSAIGGAIMGGAGGGGGW